MFILTSNTTHDIAYQVTTSHIRSTANGTTRIKHINYSSRKDSLVSQAQRVT